MPQGHPARRLVRGSWPLVVALLLLLGFGAAPASAAQTPPGGSWVRAAHLLPGAQRVQVNLAPADGAPGAAVTLSPDLSYGQSTKFRSLPPGTYAVAVRLVGSSATAQPMLSSTYTAAAGKAFTLAVLGTVAAPRLGVFPDDLTPPAAGQARVRVLAAASQATQVTVQAVGGPMIATDAVFGQPTPYASVPAGTWQLSATTPSGHPSGTSTVTLSSGAIYTVLVVNGPTGALRLTTLQDAAGPQVAPTGGAATGAGGTAPSGSQSSGPRTAAGAGLAALLVLAGLLLLRSGNRRAVTRRLRLHA